MNNISNINDIMNMSKEERKRIEEQDKKPLMLCFDNSYSIGIDIPIIKRITPYIVDNIDSIILSGRKMARELLKDISMHGIKGLLSIKAFRADVYPVCMGCGNDCIACEHNESSLKAFRVYVNTEAEKFYEREELPDDLIFSKNDYDLLNNHSINRPQTKEDFRITIEILKHIIDYGQLSKANSGQAKEMRASWDVLGKLDTESDSEFWQNQDIEEITRVVSRFRQKAKR